MKLRNIKTGEIKDTKDLIISDWFKKDWKYLYKKLKWITEEWEIYEVPEGWWYINGCYEAHATNSTLRNMTVDQEIGNYFETKEEAEKAVEKLKAWQRLKDKGFRFIEYRDTLANVGCPYRFIIEASVDACGKADLDLLFGGEE